VNVLLSRIDVHSSCIACFQWSRGGLYMASAYVNGSLLMNVDVKAFAMMISPFVEILTRLLVMRFVGSGWHDCLVMAAIRQALSLSQQRCQLWTIVSLETSGASSLPGGHNCTPVLAGRLRRLSAFG